MVNDRGQQQTEKWPKVTVFERVVRGGHTIDLLANKGTMQAFIKAIMISFSVLFSLTAWANDFRDCGQNFYKATAPDYLEQKLLNNSVPLCFNGFATLYSGVSKTPLWSAEHLTRDRLSQAENIPREDSFHPESRLPSSMRAQLSDYKGSGYDRGHLAPNGDMANVKQQYDSFSLANIIPQSPENNRYLWRNIESVTRYLTKKHGEVYVVTGVVFKGRKISQLNNRVLIPTHVFKAVYVPSTEQAGVYYAPNDDSERVEIISIDELALRSGIDAFPSIAPNAKSETMPLPVKVGDIADRADQPTDKQSEKPLWYLILIEILRWLADNFLSK
ncbi:DNA/RNA non-specific endonuclease [Psychrobacter sanguinis]|uniref:DNA/RNA non-specific endonuclease n=1 Tax=Psychrobacter sanguinis TaxID=861445 RepID=UPI002A75403E|nr:DNA/RNA non-specific endonuclease [Psychrobacter sanguinis]MDY3306507.1 DNA/RNA non-specific endonuclease [Psychrobacter sanguinis]